MLKLTTRGHYSVKALLDLATYRSGPPQSIRAIARRQNISQHFLEQLLSELRQAGFVRSVRGAQGGYLLACAPADIRLGDVLRAVGDGVEPLPRLTRAEVGAADWVAFALWGRLSRSLEAALAGVTLEDLYFDARSREASEGDGGCFIV